MLGCGDKDVYEFRDEERGVSTALGLALGLVFIASVVGVSMVGGGQAPSDSGAAEKTEQFASDLNTSIQDTNLEAAQMGWQTGNGPSASVKARAEMRQMIADQAWENMNSQAKTVLSRHAGTLTERVSGQVANGGDIVSVRPADTGVNTANRLSYVGNLTEGGSGSWTVASDVSKTEDATLVLHRASLATSESDALTITADSWNYKVWRNNDDIKVKTPSTTTSVTTSRLEMDFARQTINGQSTSIKFAKDAGSSYDISVSNGDNGYGGLDLYVHGNSDISPNQGNLANNDQWSRSATVLDNVTMDVTYTDGETTYSERVAYASDPKESRHILPIGSGGGGVAGPDDDDIQASIPSPAGPSGPSNSGPSNSGPSNSGPSNSGPSSSGPGGDTVTSMVDRIGNGGSYYMFLNGDGSFNAGSNSDATLSQREVELLAKNTDVDYGTVNINTGPTNALVIDNPRIKEKLDKDTGKKGWGITGDLEHTNTNGGYDYQPTWEQSSPGTNWKRTDKRVKQTHVRSDPVSKDDWEETRTFTESTGDTYRSDYRQGAYDERIGTASTTSSSWKDSPYGGDVVDTRQSFSHYSYTVTNTDRERVKAGREKVGSKPTYGWKTKTVQKSNTICSDYMTNPYTGKFMCVDTMEKTYTTTKRVWGQTGTEPVYEPVYEWRTTTTTVQKTSTSYPYNGDNVESHYDTEYKVQTTDTTSVWQEHEKKWEYNEYEYRWVYDG